MEAGKEEIGLNNVEPSKTKLGNAEDSFVKPDTLTAGSEIKEAVNKTTVTENIEVPGTVEAKKELGTLGIKELPNSSVFPEKLSENGVGKKVITSENGEIPISTNIKNTNDLAAFENEIFPGEISGKELK